MPEIMTYNLGPVKAHVANAASEIGQRFNVTTIYGFGMRDNVSDHPLGLALDFMVYKDSSNGHAIASYAQANYARLGVKYIIWNQRIWNPSRSGEGWRLQANRGSDTANHKDHVHVSFNASGGSGTAIASPASFPNPLDSVPNPLEPLGKALAFLTSAGNWKRLGLFWAGMALLLVGVVILLADTVITRVATKTIRSVLKGAR